MFSSMTRGLASMLCAATMLAGCATLPIAAPPPAAIADRTQLDETALLSLEVGYKAWRISLGLLVDTGQLKGERANQARLVDARIYGALTVAEAAYAASNAPSYAAALAGARKALSEALPLIEGVRR